MAEVVLVEEGEELGDEEVGWLEGVEAGGEAVVYVDEPEVEVEGGFFLVLLFAGGSRPGGGYVFIAIVEG